MEIEVFVNFDLVEKRKQENWEELENWNFGGLKNFDFGISLKFGNQNLDFKGLKIGNFGCLNFEGSYNFASN